MRQTEREREMELSGAGVENTCNFLHNKKKLFPFLDWFETQCVCVCVCVCVWVVREHLISRNTNTHAPPLLKARMMDLPCPCKLLQTHPPPTHISLSTSASVCVCAWMCTYDDGANVARNFGLNNNECTLTHTHTHTHTEMQMLVPAVQSSESEPSLTEERLSVCAFWKGTRLPVQSYICRYDI